MGAEMRMSRQHTVIVEDGYVKVKHDRLGTILGCVLREGKPHDVTFVRPEYQKQNMIRMPAIVALQNWVSTHGESACAKPSKPGK
jgi:hypothetical protein